MLCSYQLSFQSELIIMKNILLSTLSVLLLISLAGCQSSLTGDSYSRSEARKMQRVEYGIVEYLRPVKIEGTKTPIGSATGAAVGGVAASTIGSGKGRTIATVLGAVAGGVAGAAVEESVTRRQGVEITVRKDNSELISVVQEVSSSVPFYVGDRVRILTINGTVRIAQ